MELAFCPFVLLGDEGAGFTDDVALPADDEDEDVGFADVIVLLAELAAEIVRFSPDDTELSGMAK